MNFIKKLTMITSVLTFRFAFAESKIDFIMIQNESNKGLQQISIAREQNGEFSLVTNTDMYFLNQSIRLGVTTLRLQDDEIKLFNELVKNTKADDNRSAGKFLHEDQYLIKGVDISDGFTREKISSFVKKIVSKKDWTPKDTCVVSFDGGKIKAQYAKADGTKSITTEEPEKFCDKIKDKICYFKYGLIHLP